MFLSHMWVCAGKASTWNIIRPKKKTPEKLHSFAPCFCYIVELIIKDTKHAQPARSRSTRRRCSRALFTIPHWKILFKIAKWRYGKNDPTRCVCGANRMKRVCIVCMTHRHFEKLHYNSVNSAIFWCAGRCWCLFVLHSISFSLSLWRLFISSRKKRNENEMIKKRTVK